MNSVGERIRVLRKAKKMTIEDLAKVTGKSVPTIQRYETKSNSVIPVSMVNLLSEVFHCSSEWILNGNGDPNIGETDYYSCKLNAAEKTIIDSYNSLNADGKNLFAKLLMLLEESNLYNTGD